MRTIIAGSRTINDSLLVEQAVRESGFRITEVLSGGARGVDCLGEEWARRNGVPVRHFPADWERYGKRAGYVRNEEMADRAEALISVWDGRSPGTGQMIEIAKRKGLKVFVLTPNGKATQRSVSGKIVYDRAFSPDSGGGEARAVIVDDSDDDHIAFRFGITEHSGGGREVVTFQEKIREECVGVPNPVRRTLWQNLYRQAREELEREIRIATDPHYDLPEREVY
ncbi:DUF2493 domain-containing protein [Candidatus Manganitrophus noduliformans]|uniref:DUF2493 domain-containing protein n=1 Tax=Candidatus Manganitrophus noduliformans TaxID=2606439 RepID=A0A7X6DTG4_9BACT|nr:DUF2493 domain-containing protein [Candidatus Manganitrophus noduliformans]NKE72859.1 DUF2493 domain-containing protein [Candidatus Manganitrophus noduliformans]